MALAVVAPLSTYRRCLPGRECFVEVQAVVTDTRLVYDPELAWLQPDRNLELSLTALRLTRDAPWQACGGRVVLGRAPQPLSYGQTIEAAGALVLPEAPALPHQFNFRNYLRTMGIIHVLDAPAVAVREAQPHGWRRLMAGILYAREGALRLILAGVDKREDQYVLAGMTLGLYRGMDREQKEMYLRAGELHLFAVSGLNRPNKYF